MLISLVRFRRTLAPLLLAGFALALGGEGIDAHGSHAPASDHGESVGPHSHTESSPHAHVHEGEEQEGPHGAHAHPELVDTGAEEGPTGSHHAGHTCDGCVCAATAGCSAPATPATPRTSASPPHHQAPGLPAQPELAGPPPLHDIFRPPRPLI